MSHVPAKPTNSARKSTAMPQRIEEHPGYTPMLNQWSAREWALTDHISRLERELKEKGAETAGYAQLYSQSAAREAALVGRNVELRGKLASVEQLTFGNSASATAFGLRQFQTQQPARPAAPAQEPVDLGREAREQSVAKPASASTAPSAGPSHPPPPAPASKTSPAAAQSNASGRVETSASQPAPMSGSNRVVTDLATTPGDPPTPPSSASTKKRPAERAYENEEGEIVFESPPKDSSNKRAKLSAEGGPPIKSSVAYLELPTGTSGSRALNNELIDPTRLAGVVSSGKGKERASGERVTAPAESKGVSSPTDSSSVEGYSPRSFRQKQLEEDQERRREPSAEERPDNVEGNGSEHSYTTDPGLATIKNIKKEVAEQNLSPHAVAKAWADAQERGNLNGDGLEVNLDQADLEEDEVDQLEDEDEHIPPIVPQLLTPVATEDDRGAGRQESIKAQAKTDINLSDISSPEVSEASSSEDEDDKSDSTHALPPSSTPVMPVHPAVPSPAPAPTSSQMPPPSLPHVRHASGSGRGGTAPPSANAGPPTTTRPGSRASAPPAASTASGPSSGRGARGRGPRGRSHDAGSSRQGTVSPGPSASSTSTLASSSTFPIVGGEEGVTRQEMEWAREKENLLRLIPENGAPATSAWIWDELHRIGDEAYTGLNGAATPKQAADYLSKRGNNYWVHPTRKRHYGEWTPDEEGRDVDEVEEDETVEEPESSTKGTGKVGKQKAKSKKTVTDSDDEQTEEQEAER